MSLNGNNISWKIVGPAVIAVLFSVIGYVAVKNLREVDRIGMLQGQRGVEIRYIWEEIKRINERLDHLERNNPRN